MDKTVFVIGIIFLILFGVIKYTDDYMPYETHKCRVVTKMSIPTKSSANLYLVLVDVKSNIEFDIIVSASTYNKAEKDKIMYFDLRRMDIKQTTYDNAVYFLGTIITGLLAFGFILLSFLVKHIK